MKKKLMTVLALVLVIALSVAGTYAYLTSTAKVENTFTVGSVAITMDEAKVDAYGDEVDPAERTDKNTYKLIPGHTYTKDPTIHFAAGSEASWLFVKVENGIANIEAAGDTTIKAQLAKNGWTQLSEGSNIYYKQAGANNGVNATVVNYPVFGSFKIADKANTSDYANAKITVTAYAVQADGFDTANAAWTATFGAPTSGN